MLVIKYSNGAIIKMGVSDNLLPIHEASGCILIDEAEIIFDENGNLYHRYLAPDTNGIYKPDLVQIESDTLKSAIDGFTTKTTEFIQARVDEYNLANGTAFTNVHNCESYSRTIGYTHQVWCLQVWTWNVAVWEAVRALATIPTETEFKAILDAVAF